MSEGENLRVQIPSVNCILGDKLTAFAPHTTGIPLNVGKDMEIMKQMYDVSILIDHLTTLMKCLTLTNMLQSRKCHIEEI